MLPLILLLAETGKRSVHWCRNWLFTLFSTLYSKHSILALNLYRSRRRNYRQCYECCSFCDIGSDLMVHRPHWISHIFRFKLPSEPDKISLLQYPRNSPSVFIDLFTCIAPICVGVGTSAASVKRRDFGSDFMLPKCNSFLHHGK